MAKQKAKVMKLKDIRKAILNSEGKIFAIEFIRRTDSKDGTQKAGEVRKMVARIGVTKGVKGVGLAFDPLEKGLLPVYDMQKQGFRMINLDTVLSITIAGAYSETKEYKGVI